jgi:predicted phage baseplate assembly protein
LGASSGVANLSLIFTQTPVLEGELIEVRELAGPRANVEWRILARELSNGDTRLMLALEKFLSKEGPASDVQSGPLHLVRDKNRNVTEAWVLWDSKPFLYLSGPDDRDYVIDRARGVIRFGDGVTGRIPPAGAQVRAIRIQVGGGTNGNVPVGAIAQLLGPLAGVQSVTNPEPAEGGADRELMEQYRGRAPQTLRQRGRAVTPADYEAMAREASPAVAFVRVAATRSDAGRTVPGWVTLILIPESTDPRPYPSFGLREHVQQFLMDRMPADVASLTRIFVTGPAYFPVDVTVSIAPLDASEAGLVEQRVRAAIELFLHPLHGGPEGRGWELGRDLYLSDLASAVEQVEGVDYADDLTLLLDSVPQGESVRVLAGRMVVAGKISVRMIAAETQKALQLSASKERQ